jgi:hypothetical protein
VFWANAPVDSTTAAVVIKNNFFMAFSSLTTSAADRERRDGSHVPDSCHFFPIWNYHPVFPFLGCRSLRAWNLEETTMSFKTLIATSMVAAFVAPALAADEFYVVQDVKTKKCTIVDKKPADTTTTVVSPSGTVYKTRSEAETGMKSVKVCISN